MIDNTSYVVQGGTPGADSNDYVLFDSTVAFGGGKLSVLNIARFIFSVNNSQAGTLKAYWSKDKGTTWNQYYQSSIVAASAPSMNGPIDFPVDGLYDWKLVWTNGGSAQGTWIAMLTSTSARALAQ